MARENDKPRMFRVKDPGGAAVFFQETGQHEVPNPALTYGEDHYMVREASWMFVAADTPEETERRESVSIPPPVERATARPGERRTTPRPRGSQ